MTHTSYRKLTVALITAWFVFALIAGSLAWFQTDAAQPPLPLLLAVVIPITLYAFWYFTSPGFRQFVLSLSPQALTRVQAWRIVGFTFVALSVYHILPAVFAMPAGWGDVFIGGTALLVAGRIARPEHRTAFIFWQFLGIADLVIALSTGAGAQFLDPNGISTAPMTALPLSLIPTFGVPLLMILHFICIAQARRWPAKSQAHAAPVRSLAV
jgi:hypothetical protein